MTDQPKPRGPLNDREMEIYDALLIAQKELRAALAEVERLRNELATTSKGSLTVEMMQEQLAEMTKERDAARIVLEDRDAMHAYEVQKLQAQLLCHLGKLGIAREAWQLGHDSNVTLRSQLQAKDAEIKKLKEDEKRTMDALVFVRDQRDLYRTEGDRLQEVYEAAYDAREKEKDEIKSALSESHARVKELTESLNDVVSEIPSTEIWFAARDNARIILAASSSPAQGKEALDDKR